MSKELPETPWIHIGECPVCVNGLCRVRCCEDSQGNRHLYAMCDECEAIWLEPTTDSEKQFPDAEAPVCPICPRALYGPQAHWAKSEDLRGSQWNDSVIFEVPSLDLGESLQDPINEAAREESVSADHIAESFEEPPVAGSDSKHKLDDTTAVETDTTDDKDEPQPGC